VATTPVSNAYLTPTAASISVGSNLAADSQESTSSTISTNNYSIVQTTLSAATIGAIEVGTNLIADSQENTSSTISVANSSPIQNVLSTPVIGAIEVSITPISSTPTVSEQINLSKVQIWSIS
jgi:hypothetical protein